MEYNKTDADIPGAKGIFLFSILNPRNPFIINIDINVISDAEKTINGMHSTPNHAAVAVKNLMSPPPMAGVLHVHSIALENKWNAIKTKMAPQTESSNDAKPPPILNIIPITNNVHVSTSGIFFVSKSIKAATTENTTTTKKPINR